MTRRLAALALIGLLAACGTRAELHPLKGMSAVPKSAEAEKEPTPTQLMTPSTQAKPDRRADLLIKSEDRKADPFDLPPGPQNGRNGNED